MDDKDRSYKINIILLLVVTYSISNNILRDLSMQNIPNKSNFFQMKKVPFLQENGFCSTQQEQI